MTISEKSAYLKGLMDGLKLSTETDEGKMIASIVDLLGDLCKKVTDIEETTIAISDASMPESGLFQELPVR